MVNPTTHQVRISKSLAKGKKLSSNQNTDDSGAHSRHSYTGLALPFKLNKVHYIRGNGINRKYIEKVQIKALLASTNTSLVSSDFIEDRGS